MVSPALARALRVAGAGPVSMMVGSEPETAAETIRARGVRPYRSPVSLLPMATRAAPSTMPEELPAWWTWSIFSTQWYFCSATASKPPSSPMVANEGLRAASESAVVPGRMCSSWSRTTRPLRSLTGTTERAKRPSFHASAARSWESAANSSTSRREKPSMVAMRSAPMPCGTKPVS